VPVAAPLILAPQHVDRLHRPVRDDRGITATLYEIARPDRSRSRGFVRRHRVRDPLHVVITMSKCSAALARTRSLKSSMPMRTPAGAPGAAIGAPLSTAGYGQRRRANEAAATRARMRPSGRGQPRAPQTAPQRDRKLRRPASGAANQPVGRPMSGGSFVYARSFSFFGPDFCGGKPLLSKLSWRIWSKPRGRPSGNSLILLRTESRLL
jgi:hypothetical protein